MRRWRWVDPCVARATVAASYVRSESTDAQLGDVTLRDHQREAAARLRAAISRFGGALLADDVGLGKTYTALAAARDFGRILIVAPAAIAEMWRSALRVSRVEGDFVSFESLSRSAPPSSGHALVIVDEAHHARNPLTRRYGRLAEVTRAARVLLLSATPVHNATADLHAVLALFLGSRANRMTPEQRGACIVRRTREDVRDAPMPRRTPPVWMDVPGSPELLQALLDVPAPCPPRDGGDGGALVTLSLVRAWASTDAALRATLRRRIARATSLADALATGRHPTRAELRAWVVGDDATQLAFPELMVDAVTGDWRPLRDCVSRHEAGLRRALALLAEDGGRNDDVRSATIRDIRARHTTKRIVVFAQFADSVRAMFERLRADGRVAAVTADAAWVAGGSLTRSEAIARFAPSAADGRSASRAETIDLLIATDLLSEGLNLQDAAVIVHLDLPWTAARLTQRVGRIWRMASPHERVHEYAIAPPAPAERVLGILDVLARKAGAASAAMGEVFPALLRERRELGHSAPAGNPATAIESLRSLLGTWLDPGIRASRQSAQPDETMPIDVAAVRASEEGWLAAVLDGAGVRVVARRSGAPPSDDPSNALAVAHAAQGMACVALPSRVDRVLRELDAFLEAGHGRRGRGRARDRIESPGHGVRPNCRARGRSPSPPTCSRVASRRVGT